MADGPNDGVRLDGLPVTFVEFRREFSVAVEDPQNTFERHAPYLALLVANDLYGTHAVMTNDTLFVAFDDFQIVGRHLVKALEATQVDAADTRVPQGRTRHVHSRLANNRTSHVVGHVATADNDHVTSQIRPAVQCNVTQQLDAAQHARPY